MIKKDTVIADWLGPLRRCDGKKDARPRAVRVAAVNRWMEAGFVRLGKRQVPCFGEVTAAESAFEALCLGPPCVAAFERLGLAARLGALRLELLRGFVSLGTRRPLRGQRCAADPLMLSR